MRIETFSAVCACRIPRPYVEQCVGGVAMHSFTLLVTYNCPTSCEHCAYGCGPDVGPYLEVAAAARLLKDARRQP